MIYQALFAHCTPAEVLQVFAAIMAFALLVGGKIDGNYTRWF